MYRILILGLLLLFACGGKKDIDKLNFLKKGNLAYTTGNLTEAIRFYDEALAKDSAFVDAWNNKGLALMKQEDYDGAIFCFNQAINYKPDYGEALLNNARANLAVKQYFAALDNLGQLAKVWPDTSLLPFTEGLIYAGMGKPEEALAAFYHSLTLDSTNAETLVNIANVYYHQRQADSAILFIRQALKLAADQPHAYNVLAMVYAGLGQYDEALQAIDMAVSFAKNDAYFNNNKGYILLQMQRLPEAEEYIIRSMKMDPYNPWVYRNLGLLRYQQQNYADAVRLLGKAMTMDATVDHIRYDLALAYAAAGDPAKACAILNQAVSRDEKEEALAREVCR